MYRGDGSDKLSVHEWEELMFTYLRRRHVELGEQHQEMLSRLMGKARDIVKIRNIMVGRVMTPLWGDRWVPMKVTNLSDRLVTLKRNCKLADVSPCLAVEDFELLQGYNEMLALTNLTYSLVRLAPQEL